MNYQSIDDLAGHLVYLSDRRGFTPVLTPDRSIRLKPLFFANLLNAISKTSTRMVRLEVLDQPSSLTSWLKHWRTGRQVSKIGQTIPANLKCQICVERRLLLSRPSGAMRTLVIGLATREQELPEWGTRIELTTTPATRDQVHLIAA